jgi:2-phosphosulfolactate phosphatase
MLDRPWLFVHLLPTLIPAGALRGGTALVVDVLRATTVIVQALDAGCEAVIPCLEVGEARSVAARLPDGAALLGGERQGLPIPGFDLGNSPDDYTPEVCGGKTLVLTTTNGTRAIHACDEAERIGIAALSNAEAAARWAVSTAGNPVHVVCAGTDGHVSVEDSLLAGELVERLSRGDDEALGNDSALLARALFRETERAARLEHVWWSTLIAAGRGGRRVHTLGLDADIEAAGRWNSVALVPTVRRAAEPWRIVADGRG